jgi:hypothetical protein
MTHEGGDVGMLEGLPVRDLSLGTLLGLAILLILFGRLIPSSTYKEKKEECERWRLAYETERDARQVSDIQTVELLELAKTTQETSSKRSSARQVDHNAVGRV